MSRSISNTHNHGFNETREYEMCAKRDRWISDERQTLHFGIHANKPGRTIITSRYRMLFCFKKIKEHMDVD